MAKLVTGWSVPFPVFWRMYLDAHRNPGTRAAHYFASALGLASLGLAIQQQRFEFLVAGIAMGYAIAILSHKFIEGNKPLIRVNPFWGMLADMRMCWLAVSGGLRAEYRRLDLGEPAPLDRQPISAP